MKTFKSFITESVDLDTHFKYAAAGIPLPDDPKLSIKPYRAPYDADHDMITRHKYKKPDGGFVVHSINDITNHAGIVHFNKHGDIHRDDGPAATYVTNIDARTVHKSWYHDGEEVGGHHLVHAADEPPTRVFWKDELHNIMSSDDFHKHFPDPNREH